MDLFVLGSGTALPMPHRAPPGFLVTTDDTRLLLDCGSGTLQRLARLGIHPRMLSGLFVSHVHLDHWADLSPLLFSLRLPGCELDTDLPLHAGPGFSSYLAGLQATFGDWITPLGAQLVVEEHTTGRFEVGALLCRVAPMAHHHTSIGIRIDDPTGGRLAYLGDTDLCDEAIDLCRAVDLAIVECSTDDDHPLDGHLCPRKIATLAAEAQPQALLLTHFYPPAEEIDVIEALRQHGCDLPVSLAFDGMGVTISDEPA